MTMSRMSAVLLVLLVATAMQCQLVGAPVATRAPGTGTISQTAEDSFSLNSLWHNVFLSIDLADAQATVRDLSEDYPSRMWDEETGTPNTALQGAWGYVSQKLASVTGGKLHFKHWGEYQLLVAVKSGTEHHRAPIVIAGTVGSPDSPGANAFAASTAAVIETARLLSDIDLTNDVYFVLCNSVNMSVEASGAPDMGWLLDRLIAQRRTPALLIWFSRLLYKADTPLGDRLQIRGTYNRFKYGFSEFLMDMGVAASWLEGTGKIMTDSPSGTVWRKSGAYEAENRGVLALVLAQSYLDYYYSGTDQDVWDASRFHYAVLREAIGVACSMVVMMGRVGYGQAPEIRYEFVIPENTTSYLYFGIIGKSQTDVRITWNGVTRLTVSVDSPSGHEITTQSSTHGSINITLTQGLEGVYKARLVNEELSEASVQFTITHWYDIDQDGLDDYEEYQFGSDSLARDTDFDNLTDPFEQSIGTSPNLVDTDHDNLSDYEEVQLGTSPLVVDTDNDTLSDYFEVQLGTSPLTNDTDNDGIADAEELDLNTSPTDWDTDGDGLSDLQEVSETQTSPTARDSDGDHLDDLFEYVNGLDPWDVDTDDDGLTDSYEIENGMNPFSNDTDTDGLPDASDWAPTEHWMVLVPRLTLAVVAVVVIAVLLYKRHKYLRMEVTDQ